MGKTLFRAISFFLSILLLNTGLSINASAFASDYEINTENHVSESFSHKPQLPALFPAQGDDQLIDFQKKNENHSDALPHYAKALIRKPTNLAEYDDCNDPGSNSIKISPSIGVIEDCDYTGEKGVVYLIQDAHSSLEVQENISQILEFLADKLITNSDPLLVCVEGTSVNLTERLSLIFDDHQLDYFIIAEIMMQISELTGVQFSGVCNPDRFIIKGVEKQSAYESNLGQMKHLILLNNKYDPHINNLFKQIRNLKEKYYPFKIMHLDDQRQKGGFSAEYLAQLVSLVDGCKLDLSMYPVLRSVISEQQDEFTIGKTRALIRECEILDGKVKSTVLEGDAAVLWEFEKAVISLSEMMKAGLSSAKFDGIYDRRAEFYLRFEYLSEWVSSVSDEWNADLRMNADELIIIFEAAMKFYRNARQRDKYLALNTVRTMQKRKRSSSVLVAGGFHKDGIKRVLSEMGYSYVVISPVISSIDKGFSDLYYRSVSGLNNSPLKVISSFLALNIPFENFITDERISPKSKKDAVHLFSLSMAGLIHFDEFKRQLSDDIKSRFRIFKDESGVVIEKRESGTCLRISKNGEAHLLDAQSSIHRELNIERLGVFASYCGLIYSSHFNPLREVRELTSELRDLAANSPLADKSESLLRVSQAIEDLFIKKEYVWGKGVMSYFGRAARQYGRKRFSQLNMTALLWNEFFDELHAGTMDAYHDFLQFESSLSQNERRSLRPAKYRFEAILLILKWMDMFLKGEKDTAEMDLRDVISDVGHYIFDKQKVNPDILVSNLPETAIINAESVGFRVGMYLLLIFCSRQLTLLEGSVDDKGDFYLTADLYGLFAGYNSSELKYLFEGKFFEKLDHLLDAEQVTLKMLKALFEESDCSFDIVYKDAQLTQLRIALPVKHLKFPEGIQVSNPDLAISYSTEFAGLPDHVLSQWIDLIKESPEPHYSEYIFRMWETASRGISSGDQLSVKAIDALLYRYLNLGHKEAGEYIYEYLSIRKSNIKSGRVSPLIMRVRTLMNKAGEGQRLVEVFQSADADLRERENCLNRLGLLSNVSGLEALLPNIIDMKEKSALTCFSEALLLCDRDFCKDGLMRIANTVNDCGDQEIVSALLPVLYEYGIIRLDRDALILKIRSFKDEKSEFKRLETVLQMIKCGGLQIPEVRKFVLTKLNDLLRIHSIGIYETGQMSSNLTPFLKKFLRGVSAEREYAKPYDFKDDEIAGFVSKDDLDPVLELSEFYKVLWRTVIYKDENGHCIALKFLKEGEDLRVLFHESMMQESLDDLAEPLKLQGVIPEAIKINDRRVFKIKIDSLPDGLLERIESSNPDLRLSRDAGYLSFIAYRTPDEEYFKYISDDALSMEEFELGLFRSVDTLFKLIDKGIAHTAVADLYHSEDQNRTYFWPVGLLSSHNESMGRMDAWTKAVDNPNLRLSGPADFAEYEFFERMIFNKDNVSGLTKELARYGRDKDAFTQVKYIGDNLLAFSIYIGKKYRDLNLMDWKSKDEVQKLSGLIRKVFTQSYSTFISAANSDGMKLAAGLIDWDLLARQMCFFMAKGEPYAEYLVGRNIPNEITGGVEVKYAEYYTEQHSWGSLTDGQGFYLDGVNPDIGAFNSVFTITELVKALHVFSSMMVWEKAEILSGRSHPYQSRGIVKDELVHWETYKKKADILKPAFPEVTLTVNPDSDLLKSNPDLVALFSDGNKLSDLLVLCSALRTEFSYQDVSYSPSGLEGPLEFAVRNNYYVHIEGDLYVTFVTESFRRHILFKMNDSGDIYFTASMKMPGNIQKEQRHIIDKGNYEKPIEINNSSEVQIMDNPYLYAQLNAKQMSLYGKRIDYVNDSPAIILYEYRRDARRLLHVLREGNENIMNAYPKLYDGDSRLFERDILVQCAELIAQVHAAGFCGHRLVVPEEGTEAHYEFDLHIGNIGVEKNNNVLRLSMVNDIVAFIRLDDVQHNIAGKKAAVIKMNRRRDVNTFLKHPGNGNGLLRYMSELGEIEARQIFEDAYHRAYNAFSGVEDGVSPESSVKGGLNFKGISLPETMRGVSLRGIVNGINAAGISKGSQVLEIGPHINVQFSLLASLAGADVDIVQKPSFLFPGHDEYVDMFQKMMTISCNQIGIDPHDILSRIRISYVSAEETENVRSSYDMIACFNVFDDPSTDIYPLTDFIRRKISDGSSLLVSNIEGHDQAKEDAAIALIERGAASTVLCEDYITIGAFTCPSKVLRFEKKQDVLSSDELQRMAESEYYVGPNQKLHIIVDCTSIQRGVRRSDAINLREFLRTKACGDYDIRFLVPRDFSGMQESVGILRSAFGEEEGCLIFTVFRENFSLDRIVSDILHSADDRDMYYVISNKKEQLRMMTKLENVQRVCLAGQYHTQLNPASSVVIAFMHRLLKTTDRGMYTVNNKSAFWRKLGDYNTPLERANAVKQILSSVGELCRKSRIEKLLQSAA